MTSEPPGGSAPADRAPPPERHGRRAEPVLAGAGAMALIALAIVLAAPSVSRRASRPGRPAAALSVGRVRSVRHQARRSLPAVGIDALMRRQPVVFQGALRGNEVALTFDDGPGPYTRALVAELQRLHVRATFFAVGEMERYFGAATRVEQRLGDAVEDHTDTHPVMARLPYWRQRSEIVAQRERVQQLAVSAPRLYRPPYGAYDGTTLAVLRHLHMLLVLWSADTRDYTRPGVGAIVSRALAGARPGAIILLHDGGGDRSQTVAALSQIVRGLHRRGLRPVTVERLLIDDPPPPGRRIARLPGD